MKIYLLLLFLLAASMTAAIAVYTEYPTKSPMKEGWLTPNAPILYEGDKTEEEPQGEPEKALPPEEEHDNDDDEDPVTCLWCNHGSEIG